ncbi:MAG: alcohol dehydrogenase catalytic domain-containing protein [Chloroflexi bacterium]|nr:alcohol dehydrogenase catalytic domain-containing protein [Chloroflexota bacterium]
MQGLWLEDQVLTYRKDLPVPAPQAGEALIKTRLAGICATDLEMTRGYYPFTGVPGHEFVGEVVEAPGFEDWVGQRVVGEINLVCGICRACRAGRGHHCEERRVLGLLGKDGVLADYFTLPIENLHPVPETLPDEAAVFTELLAAALEVEQQVHIQPDMKALVVGAGRLGLLIAQVLKLNGCDLAVLVRRQAQVQLLARWGIPAVDERTLTKGAADLVVEATGSPAGFALAREALRPAGTLILKSAFAGDMRVNLSKLVVDEIRLVGSRCGPFASALRLLTAGLVDTASLVSRRYTLAQGVQAFEQAAAHGVLKVLVSGA